MHRNIGPCYCKSGLSLEVSLIALVSHHRFHRIVHLAVTW